MRRLLCFSISSYWLCKCCIQAVSSEGLEAPPVGSPEWKKERWPHGNFSALPAVKREAEEHWGQGSGASGDSPAPTTHHSTPCCSLSHQWMSHCQQPPLTLRLPSMFKAFGLSPHWAGWGPGQFWKDFPHTGFGFSKFLLSISTAISKAIIPGKQSMKRAQVPWPSTAPCLPELPNTEKQDPHTLREPKPTSSPYLP